MNEPAPARADIVIRNGEVIDGSGATRTRADVAISGERITAIGQLGGTAAALEIDAANRILAPGFIDVHTHDDGAMFASPEMTAKLSQGVTTAVCGNCGFSLAPLAPGRALPQEFRLLGDDEAYRYPTIADYVAAFARQPAAINAALLVGHSTLRMGAMSELTRPADDREIALMRDSLAQGLAEGAIGFSTGLEYSTARAAPTEEIAAVAAPLGPAGGVYATHTRDYRLRLDEAMEEAFEIGRRVEAPVVLSHHQGDGPRNYGHSPRTLARIDRARAHQPVGLDVYPYNVAATVIDPAFAADAERVTVTWSEPHPEMEGRDLADIAKLWGCGEAEACRRLAPGGAVYYCQDEADVRRILAYPHTMIGSDGLPGGRIRHPRLWGTFPRVLGHYARDLELFTLEDAVRKMTGLSAERFGLAGRGRVVPGAVADITVFDAGSVADRATFAEPERAAAGIDLVLVGGVPAWRDGRATGERPGRIVTHRAQ